MSLPCLIYSVIILKKFTIEKLNREKLPRKGQKIKEYYCLSSLTTLL